MSDQSHLKSAFKESLEILGSDGGELMLGFLMGEWKSMRGKNASLEEANEELKKANQGLLKEKGEENKLNQDLSMKKDEELRSKTKSIKDLKKALGEEKERSDKKVNEICEENKVLASETKKMEAEIDSKKSEFTKMRESIKDLNDRIATILVERDSYRSQKDSLLKGNTEAIEERKNVTKHRNALLEENATLKQEKVGLLELNEKFARSKETDRKNINKLRRDVKALTKKSASSETVATVAELRIESMEGGIQNLAKEWKQANAVLRETRGIAEEFDAVWGKSEKEDKKGEKSLSKNVSLANKILEATKRKSRQLDGEKVKRRKTNQEVGELVDEHAEKDEGNGDVEPEEEEEEQEQEQEQELQELVQELQELIKGNGDGNDEEEGTSEVGGN